ncbi:MAG: hypothetical protein HQM16_18460 [Deltaproteobacteria bacterium]|nr:hypothetical protein [Deltaproteobacteria bacterium]
MPFSNEPPPQKPLEDNAEDAGAGAAAAADPQAAPEATTLPQDAGIATTTETEYLNPNVDRFILEATGTYSTFTDGAVPKLSGFGFDVGAVRRFVDRVGPLDFDIGASFRYQQLRESANSTEGPGRDNRTFMGGALTLRANWDICPAFNWRILALSPYIGGSVWNTKLLPNKATSPVDSSGESILGGSPNSPVGPIHADGFASPKEPGLNIGLRAGTGAEITIVDGVTLTAEAGVDLAQVSLKNPGASNYLFTQSGVNPYVAVGLTYQFDRPESVFGLSPTNEPAIEDGAVMAMADEVAGPVIVSRIEQPLEVNVDPFADQFGGIKEEHQKEKAHIADLHGGDFSSQHIYGKLIPEGKFEEAKTAVQKGLEDAQQTKERLEALRDKANELSKAAGNNTDSKLGPDLALEALAVQETIDTALQGYVNSLNTALNMIVISENAKTQAEKAEAALATKILEAQGIQAQLAAATLNVNASAEQQAALIADLQARLAAIIAGLEKLAEGDNDFINRNRQAIRLKLAYNADTVPNLSAQATSVVPFKINDRGEIVVSGQPAAPVVVLKTTVPKLDGSEGTEEVYLVSVERDLAGQPESVELMTRPELQKALELNQKETVRQWETTLGDEASVEFVRDRPGPQYADQQMAKAFAGQKPAQRWTMMAAKGLDVLADTSPELERLEARLAKLKDGAKDHIPEKKHVLSAYAQVIQQKSLRGGHGLDRMYDKLRELPDILDRLEGATGQKYYLQIRGYSSWDAGTYETVPNSGKPALSESGQVLVKNTDAARWAGYRNKKLSALRARSMALLAHATVGKERVFGNGYGEGMGYGQLDPANPQNNANQYVEIRIVDGEGNPVSFAQGTQASQESLKVLDELTVFVKVDAEGRVVDARPFTVNRDTLTITPSRGRIPVIREVPEQQETSAATEQAATPVATEQAATPAALEQAATPAAPDQAFAFAQEPVMTNRPHFGAGQPLTVPLQSGKLPENFKIYLTSYKGKDFAKRPYPLTAGKNYSIDRKNNSIGLIDGDMLKNEVRTYKLVDTDTGKDYGFAIKYTPEQTAAPAAMEPAVTPAAMEHTATPAAPEQPVGE